ncbi:MAG: hypothetical protein M3304_06260 [Actinomycetota bacterium]|nr:hypothetical protein [Actinomycetota bacterium]
MPVFSRPHGRYDPIVLAYRSGHVAELVEALRASLPVLVAGLAFSLALFVASAATGRRDMAVAGLFLPFAVAVGATIVFWAL